MTTADTTTAGTSMSAGDIAVTLGELEVLMTFDNFDFLLQYLICSRCFLADMKGTALIVMIAVTVMKEVYATTAVTMTNP